MASNTVKTRTAAAAGMSRREKLRAAVKSTAFTYALLVLFGLAEGAMAMLIGTGEYGIPMFFSYFSSFTLVALNMLPPVLLMLLVYLVVGKAWMAFLPVSLLVSTLSFVNFFRMQIRGDAFVAADMSLVREAGMTFNSSYGLKLDWRLFLAAAFIAAGALVLCKFAKRRPGAWFVRAFGAVAMAALSFALFIGPYSNAALYENTQSESTPEEDLYTRDFISRGFVYPFIHSVQDLFPKPPESYTPQTVDELLGAYGYNDIPDGKKVDIISVMLEAYCDLSQYESLNFTTDVYAGLHALQTESVHGQLINNIFSGGTIDTERLFLTGYTRMESYTEPTDTYLYYLKDQGYATEGFHPGDGWFYSREEVHKYLGFDNYYFIDSFEDSAQSDAYFFDKVAQMYGERDSARPYFSHNLTIQNHGAYYDTGLANGSYIERGELSEPAYYILNNYLAGIYDTTQRIAAFVDGFRDSGDPVIILLYGDHKPWLGNNEYVYGELGISLAPETDDGFYNRYTTPYVIWANDAAKSVLGNGFTGEGGDFSPCFLMNKLFELCSWEGDEYMKAANALLEHIDVVNTPTNYFRLRDGSLTDTLTGAAEKAYADFRIIEYHRRQLTVNN
ncbi:MAG: LTA synthase family protein [Oscillospiraceae bacterium]|nr:LTA synthase family protein [Oscillospiraceae bacterium]